MPFRAPGLARSAPHSKRGASRVSVLSLLPLAALAAAACGQITGLSDDYRFDLVDGGGATPSDGAIFDAAADAASVDAAVDARDGGASADAANICTPAETATAAQQLATYRGTRVCKACLAPACCDDVVTCAQSNECSRVLGCKLDCTSRPVADRQQCFDRCSNVGGGVPALYTTGMGACAATSCKQDCAFQ